MRSPLVYLSKWKANLIEMADAINGRLPQGLSLRPIKRQNRIQGPFEVKPVGRRGWSVLSTGPAGEVRHFTKKQEAVREAMRLAREVGSLVSVFDRNGQVQKKHSFLAPA